MKIGSKATQLRPFHNPDSNPKIAKRIRNIAPSHTSQAERDALYAGGTLALPSFTPASLSGLKVWYEARNTGFAYADLADVTQMNDLSGNGIHLNVVNVGNEPQFFANGGNPYILFTGANKLSRLNVALSSIVAMNAGTIFYMSKDVGPGNDSTGYFIEKSGDEKRLNIHNAWSSGDIFIDWGNISAGGRVNFAAPATYWDDFKIDIINRNGNTINYYYNGGLHFSGSFTDQLIDATAQFYVGATDISGVNDQFQAMISYNRSLSLAEMAQVFAYLNLFRL